MGYEADVTSNTTSNHVSKVTMPNADAMLIQVWDQRKHSPIRPYDAMLEYVSNNEHSLAIH